MLIKESNVVSRFYSTHIVEISLVALCNQSRDTLRRSRNPLEYRLGSPLDVGLAAFVHGVDTYHECFVRFEVYIGFADVARVGALFFRIAPCIKVALPRP